MSNTQFTPRVRTVWLLQGEDQERLDELHEIARELDPGPPPIEPVEPVAPENPEDDADYGEALRAYRTAQAKYEADVAEHRDEMAAFTAAAEARNAFAKQARERGVRVVVRAVGSRVWRRFAKECPPREDHESDLAVGVNEEDFAERLVPAALASPTFSTDEDREAWLDRLSDAQWTQLYNTAFVLTKTLGASSDPLVVPQ